MEIVRALPNGYEASYILVMVLAGLPRFGTRVACRDQASAPRFRRIQGVIHAVPP
jgi:hypothetical protein